MKKLLATATLVLALSPVLNVSVAYAETPDATAPTVSEIPAETATNTPIVEIPETTAFPVFNDVPTDNKYFESVKNVAQRGLMKGTASNSFLVTNFVTRTDVIYAITRAANLKAKKLDTQAFKDIRKNNPAYKEIMAAQENELLGAFPTKRNIFNPKAKVTVAQALDALYKAFDADDFSGEVELRYELKTELPENWDFTTDIRRAVKEGVLMQKADGTLFIDPTQNMTRGDFASLLYRFTETRKEGFHFGLASWYGNGLSKRKVNGGRANELAQNYLTAANRDLPMGTIIKVTNQNNGKSVDVVVNDSGPYVSGRVIDLSRSGFAAIADIGAGTAVVKIEVIQKAE